MKKLKKLKKLYKNPRGFFIDFIKNRGRQFSFKRKIAVNLSAAIPGAKKSPRRYSVISAVYNVEAYLDEFFESLKNQTLDFNGSIEVVMVDDGSPDGSEKIIRKWQKKYPNNIKYVGKINGGQASARNLGLEYATGQWVTFIDPDDFVVANYFEQVDLAIEQQKSPLGLVACNMIFYHEKGRKFSDSHPLKYRFAKGSQIIDLSKPTKHFQMSAATAFFDANVISRQGLRFDERIKPNFEDAHFVNSYLLHVIDRPAVFSAAAKYFYRKRGDGTSTLDTSWEQEGAYTDVLEYGVLALMRLWLDRHGSVPVFIQRMALYHLMWYLRRLINNDKAIAFLDSEKKDRFKELLNDIFLHIDYRTIDSFDLAGIWFLHRVGLFSTFKKSEPIYQIVYVGDVDERRKLVQLKYFRASPGFELLQLDGREIDPVFSTSRIHTFAGCRFVEERIIWIPLRAGSTFSIQLEMEDVRISFNKSQRKTLALSDVIEQYRVSRVAFAKPKGFYVRAIRYLSKSNWAQRKYRDAWLLMDRDTQADDNAEHLYRHIKNQKNHVNAYFALSPSSNDWKRLKQDGFNLIKFGGWRHKILMLHCEHFISSNIDQYVLNVARKEDFGDLLRYRFTFLQHGVTKDDLADWLNQKNIDCFVTSASREYFSIVDSKSRYKFSSREVVLSGMPRHDELLGQSAPEKTIVIMPTWRLFLLGKTHPGTSKRYRNNEFTESTYFKEWSGFLKSAELSLLAREAGYRIVYYLHPNMLPYSELFETEGIEILSHETSSIQTIFKSASVLITDYSSVAFDVAIMKRPVLYFQFDGVEFFSGHHAYQKGYFDYEFDGFGPVCTDRAALMRALREVLEVQATMGEEYVGRVDNFFSHWDGKSSERTFQAIADLDKPAHSSPLSQDELRLAIGQAFHAKKWNSVVQRCARFLALHGRWPDADTLVCLSYANRRLGNFPAAKQAMSMVDVEPMERQDIAIERAEIYSNLSDWINAVQAWEALVSVVSRDEGDIWLRANQALHEALMKSEQYVKALSLGISLTEFPEQNVISVSDFVELASIAESLENIEFASRLAMHVLAISDKNLSAQGKAYAILAFIFERRGEKAGAFSMWSCALRVAPNESAYLVGYEDSLKAKSDGPFEERDIAIFESIEVEDRMERDHKIHDLIKTDDLLLCSILLRKEMKFEEARKIVDSLLAQNRSDFFVRLEAGELALGEKNWKLALRVFEELYTTNLGKRMEGVARGLLIARAEAGVFKDIKGLVATASEKFPEDTQVTHALALVASFEKRWVDAHRSWAAVMASADSYEIEERMHAGAKSLEALLNMERLEEALNLCVALLDLSPDDYYLLKTFPEISMRVGDWGLAVKGWRNAEEKSKTLEERRHCARMQAVAMWWSGDRGNARVHLSREIQTTAFNMSLEALKKGDVVQAFDHLSHVSFEGLDSEVDFVKGERVKKYHAKDVVAVRAGNRGGLVSRAAASNNVQPNP